MSTDQEESYLTMKGTLWGILIGVAMWSVILGVLWLVIA